MKTPYAAPSAVLTTFAALAFSASVHAQSYTNLAVTNELKLDINPGDPDITKLLTNGCFYSIKPRPANDTPILGLDSYVTDSTVFFWEAGRTALRAGLFSGARLNPWNMGVASTAFGYNTEAYGLALAGGSLSRAHGYGSLAHGQFSYTTGGWSLAVGDSASALNFSAAALGIAVTASGGASVALHGYTLAAGDYSFAAGMGTRADARNSFALGRYNIGGFTGANGGTVWNPQDPVFEIGIGDEPTAASGWQPVRANAVTVYKNGRVIIHKAQGDILMGDFGN